MQSNTFTAAERLIYRAQLLQLYRNDTLRPTRDTARQTADIVGRLLNAGGKLHDGFGLNKVNIALETALLAAEEIGLHGDLIPAFIVNAIAFGSDDAKPILAQCPASMQPTLTDLANVQRLMAKTEAMKTENFRNLFVSQTSDMRVVLLLIAWCVVIMRHVKDTPFLDIRKTLATEASCLYAPLAHKLGLYKLKSELEDLSLKYLESEAYYMIKENLNATKRARDTYIENFIAPIRKMLDAEGLRYHMKGRTKSIYSIWQKMKKQKCGFNGVYDLFAIRIIIDAPAPKEKDYCWKVFSLITNKYTSNLNRLRDWLTVPKSNGYESLQDRKSVV